MKSTDLGKARAASVATEAWFDEAAGSLWLGAKDGDLVCVPPDRLEKLKKLIRRGHSR